LNIHWRCVTADHSRMKTEAALARSSEEVSRALDQFLHERQDAAEAQDRALKLYEAEMLHISAEGDEEERAAVYVLPFDTLQLIAK
jgi:hypothetical protein